MIQSYEPGEDWFYDFRSGEAGYGPELAPPTGHPANQPAPGPAGAVPANWQSLLH